MNILEILADVLGLFGPPIANNDRSAVGESPIERKVALFWRRLGFLLLLLAGMAALYVYGVKHHLAPASPLPPSACASWCHASAHG